ncbi:MAG TPA: glycosyltransferase [Crocinitomicaceae bacterium]|nr:glycosyltransferase [Crocinitomicaceae bacterium]
MKKLLIVGSNTIHTYNYIALIQDYFDGILLITNEEREGYSIKTIELDFSLSVKNIFKTVKEIRKQIIDFQPSVIHIHQANSYAFYTLLANKKINIPTILTIWGSDVLVTPHKNALLKKMVAYNLSKATYLTADAKFITTEAERLTTPKNKILIANFGIGIEPKPTEKENIIYSNRLHKKLYRIDKIIDTFHQFVQSTPTWKLVIGAIGDETENLKQKVADLQLENDVQFVGWVDKIQNEKWYSKAKFWVSIPQSDATAISLLEAMACGCIPIVSDLPANREWIVNQQNGLIVSNLNEDFYSQALTINFDKAIELNKIKIQQEGTKEANREKFINLYTQILQK